MGVHIENYWTTFQNLKHVVLEIRNEPSISSLKLCYTAECNAPIAGKAIIHNYSHLNL